MADGYDIGGCRFIVGGIGRTDNDVVLLVRQFVVVAEDDVGLVRIYAVTADLVLRADDIVVLAVGQFVLEAIDEVILRRRTFCISAVCARDFVSNAGDLGHIGTFNVVAAAHDHDLSTAGRNGFLQILSYSCCIFLRDILLHLAQIEFRGINGAIRIGDCIACTIDDGSIRINRRIGLTDNAVSYTAMLFRDICVLVNVECTIGQSRCTLQTCSNNAGIGTGYSRCNTVGMGVKAGSHTACTFGTIILFIAVTGNGRQQFIIGYFIFNRIVFDVMSLIIQRNCIGFDLCIEGTQVLAGGVVYINVIQGASWLIIVIERLACYQLVGSRCIRSLVGCTCSERTCTKSQAPGVFIILLLFFCCISFRDGFSIVTNGIGLQVAAYIGGVRLSIRFQLFHDNGIMSIFTIVDFNEAVVGSCLMRIFCNRWVFGIIIKSIIRIS